MEFVFSLFFVSVLQFSLGVRCVTDTKLLDYRKKRKNKYSAKDSIFPT